MDTKVWHDLLLVFYFQFIFELDRALVADGGVETHSVVVAVDVAKRFLPGVGEISECADRLESVAGDKLGLEAREEAFGLGVVVAIPATAHRLSQAAALEQIAIGTRDVLRAAVGVNNRSTFYQVSSQCHSECLDNQISLKRIGYRPSDDSFCQTILKRRQITEPAREKRQISDVADNLFARSRSCGRTAQKVRRDQLIVPRISRSGLE